MLNTIRKNKNSVVVVLIAGFVAILMLGFGVGGSGRSGGNVIAIKVNDSEYTQAEYFGRLNRASDMARRQFGAQFATFRKFLRLEQKTLDDIINEKLMRDYLKSLGLTASNVQVEEKIAESPFFQKNQPSGETLKLYLQMLGVSEERLIALTRDEIAENQLRELLADLTSPSETELKAAYINQKTKSEFAYLTFNNQDFEKKVNVNEEEKINEYYKQNSEKYRKPKSIKFSYLKFDSKNFADKVEVIEGDLREIYENRLPEFSEPREVKLRQIVFNKPPVPNEPEDSTKQEEAMSKPDPLAEKRALADKTLERLKAGEDFSKVATEVSEDKSTATDGGDRGWISVKTLEPAINKATEDLDRGEFTGVLDTPTTLAIYYLEDVKESKPKPFETVRPDIERELRTANAPEYSRIAAESFLDSWLENSAVNLSEHAAKSGMTAQTSEKFLTATEEVPAEPGLSAQVIKFSERAREVVHVGLVDYVIEVTEIKDAFIPEIAEVKEAVLKDYQKIEASRLAKEAAEKALKTLIGQDQDNKKMSLAELAQEYSLSIKNTDPTTREDASNDELFVNPVVKTAAFTLTEENPFPQNIGEGSSGYYVYQLVKRIPPSEEELKKEREQLLSKERTKVQERLFSALMESLKTNANIWVDPKIMELSADTTTGA